MLTNAKDVLFKIHFLKWGFLPFSLVSLSIFVVIFFQAMHPNAAALAMAAVQQQQNGVLLNGSSVMSGERHLRTQVVQTPWSTQTYELTNETIWGSGAPGVRIGMKPSRKHEVSNSLLLVESFLASSRNADD